MAIGLPRGDHNDVGFDLASVIEECTSFVEPLELRAALDLDLTADDHGAGPDIWRGSFNPSDEFRGDRILPTDVESSSTQPHEPDETRVVLP